MTDCHRFCIYFSQLDTCGLKAISVNIFSTELPLILSLFVATDVNALFTKFVKKNCNMNIQNEGGGNGCLNNVEKAAKLAGDGVSY